MKLFSSLRVLVTNFISLSESIEVLSESIEVQREKIVYFATRRNMKSCCEACVPKRNKPARTIELGNEPPASFLTEIARDRRVPFWDAVYKT